MPTDSHGNKYVRMIGRSRLVTNEQKQRMIARDHADRGCCDNGEERECEATETEPQQ